MIQKSARVAANKVFRRETLSFADIPGQSNLFIDFQANSANIEKFYPEKSTPLKDFAERVLTHYKIDRNALCDTLAATNATLGAGQKTFENIERLRESDCLAIVTGQQAGLFSGALYTIYKILSALKLAEDLRQTNIKTVPIFWIAEEDHDFEEVKKTFNLNKENQLFALENTPRNYKENNPVGLIEFDETIENVIADLFEELPPTEFTTETLETLAETYRSGESYSRAFAKFLTKIFADYGLIIVSPLNKNLKELCSPIFAEAVKKSSAISSALLERNRELNEKKYQPQVLVTKDFFPFFFQNENGERQSLRRNLENEKVKLQNTKTEFELSELAETARNSPQNLSPNALMRPIVQDYLLPTLAYYGGAAEIAYFAQNSVIYEILNRPVTPIRHRASLTVIERKNFRSFKKYQLNINKLFDGKEKIWAQVVENFFGRETARAFAEVEKNINTQLDHLGEHLLDNEPTLAMNLTNRRKKIVWHLGALRKKYHRAETLKNDVAYRRIESLFASLLPHGALQERTLNITTFLNLYGVNFIEWIYEAVEADEKNHQILYL